MDKCTYKYIYYTESKMGKKGGGRDKVKRREEGNGTLRTTKLSSTKNGPKTQARNKRDSYRHQAIIVTQISNNAQG